MIVGACGCQHGKEMKELATHDMGNSIYTTPVASNGVLYIAKRNALVAIQAGAKAGSRNE